MGNGGTAISTINFGYDSHRYRRIRSWGQVPNGWKFGKISAAAVDSQDRVYLGQRTDKPLVVLDRDGKLITTWGHGIISEAHGIFIDREDRVYVVDREAHQVLKFSAEGRLLLALGSRGQPARDAPFNFPTDACISQGGEIYVSDGYGNSRVHKFSNEGSLLLSWGTAGSAPGQFRVPHGITVDAQERVYVCDRENNRVQIFTADGSPITQWTDFYRPTDIHYAERSGTMFITDHTPRVSILDLEGNLLARGQSVDVPHGICVDSRGDFYVVSNQERQIDKYVHE